MAAAHFINTDYVYKWTIIEDNVDPDLIFKYIEQAQTINIQEVLGSNLYNKLVTDCPDFTGYYRTLVKDYIQPAQAQWVVYHIIPFINYKLTNKAISQKSSDNSQPSALADIKFLMDKVRINAEFLSERIKDYIKNNETQFPEFFTTNPEDPYNIRPNRNNYYGGIWTTKRGPYGR